MSTVGSMFRRTAVLALALSACTAAYKTTSGGATAKPGVEGGTTSSIYLGDRGGLLTRLGLAGVGAAAAVGSVENVQSTTREVGRDDRYIYTETTTTGTVNAERARGAQQILDTAGDWKQDLGGLSAGLEIASTKLGGDTSGWMFDFGNTWTSKFGSWGARGSLKIKFGKMTFHDRVKRTVMNLGVSEVMEEQTYSLLGFPVRAGLTYRGIIELFFQADLNVITAFQMQELFTDLSPSPSLWHVGARLAAFKFLYVEAVMSVSAMRESRTSYGLEGGFAF